MIYAMIVGESKQETIGTGLSPDIVGFGRRSSCITVFFGTRDYSFVVALDMRCRSLARAFSTPPLSEGRVAYVNSGPFRSVGCPMHRINVLQTGESPQLFTWIGCSRGLSEAKKAQTPKLSTNHRVLYVFTTKRSPVYTNLLERLPSS
eukprot:sb/3473709/